MRVADLHLTCKATRVPALLDKFIQRPRNREHQAHRHAKAYKVLAVVSLIALILQTSMLLLSLFEQPLAYEITEPGPEPIDSPEFTRVTSAITFGAFSTHNRVDVLTN